jgi:hypothetical protein
MTPVIWTGLAKICATAALSAVLCAPSANAARSTEDVDSGPRGEFSQIERSRRILELERGVAQARRRLMVLLSETETADQIPLRDRPELREIAAELETMSVELDRLRSGPPASLHHPIRE